MRLPIERYSTSRKKSPATGVFGSGAWPFLPIQRSTALLAGRYRVELNPQDL
jgi:hypothetical protein